MKACLPYGLLWLRRKYKSKIKQQKLGKFSRIELFTAKVFKEKFIETDSDGKNRFNFNGAFIPDISEGDMAEYLTLTRVFSDSFMFSVLFNENYDKKFVEIMDLYMHEGPYGYKDGDFDVTVKRNDIVIDAGAWIGDFSAYVASKGACAYAFEPGNTAFQVLEKTAEMNHGGKIYPVKKGLGDKNYETFFTHSLGHSAGGTIKTEITTGDKVEITSLDKFVEENNIEKIDFIKADIEGAENDMLVGAKNVLKTYQPKLVICTYHKPDDPETLAKTILEINPKYKIVQLRMKLFACVV